MNRCDICLEETCGGKKNCNCSECKLKKECPRNLRPTIRITNKCTQECMHCCFSSSPKSDIQMSVEQAKVISKFLKTNEITYINVMGGEFFCNPNWKEILETLISPVKLMRLVSNGDWAVSLELSKEILEFFSKYKNKIYVCISGDKWHTRKHIEEAERLLKESNILHKISTDEDLPDMGIVPVGRSSFGCGGLYGMMATYCSNPECQYTFLIDEEGNIYKCVWGVMSYANVKNYTEETFYSDFKNFNKKFYNCFIPSCKSCYNYFKFYADKDVCVKE